MAWVVAASSLFHSLNILRPAEKAELDELVYAESGLSLNPHTVRKRQNLQTLLEEHPLVDKEIILWHDVLNNSLSNKALSSGRFKFRICNQRDIGLRRLYIAEEPERQISLIL